MRRILQGLSSYTLQVPEHGLEWDRWAQLGFFTEKGPFLQRQQVGRHGYHLVQEKQNTVHGRELRGSVRAGNLRVLLQDAAGTLHANDSGGRVKGRKRRVMGISNAKTDVPTVPYTRPAWYTGRCAAPCCSCATMHASMRMLPKGMAGSMGVDACALAHQHGAAHLLAHPMQKSMLQGT